MKQATKQSVKNTTQRDWQALKPGDVIRFANGWFEVFDAYACGRDIVKVKLIVDGHIVSHKGRTTNGPATCHV